MEPKILSEDVFKILTKAGYALSMSIQEQSLPGGGEVPEYTTGPDIYRITIRGWA